MMSLYDIVFSQPLNSFRINIQLKSNGSVKSDLNMYIYNMYSVSIKIQSLVETSEKKIQIC